MYLCGLHIIFRFKFEILACLDTEKFTKSEVYKAIFGLMFHLMKDEANQVNGFTMMVDCTGFEMRHLLFFGIEDMKRMQRFWQVIAFAFSNKAMNMR